MINIRIAENVHSEIIISTGISDSGEDEITSESVSDVNTMKNMRGIIHGSILAIVYFNLIDITDKEMIVVKYIFNF
jgi:hypothetical protein